MFHNSAMLKDIRFHFFGVKGKVRTISKPAVNIFFGAKYSAVAKPVFLRTIDFLPAIVFPIQ
jgi:hypothetical protein